VQPSGQATWTNTFDGALPVNGVAVFETEPVVPGVVVNEAVFGTV
jgi:hypothetical protein